MKLDFITAEGVKIPLVGSDYFTITDIDGMTQGDVSISATTMSDTDGDYINSQAVNPRDVTFTLRFKDTVPVEDTKRYILHYFKLKREAVIELDYKNRVSRLTGTVQSIEIPRFGLGVTAQISLHCSNPFWEDVQAIQEAINDITNLHHWAIHPTSEEPIVMGEIMDAYRRTIINDGDVSVGIRMVVIVDRDVSNPKIMRDETSEFFEVAVDMHEKDELVISTIKGKKYVTLNGVSVINKVVAGSTWLQLEVGANVFVTTNNLGGKGMTFNVFANERYL